MLMSAAFMKQPINALCKDNYLFLALIITFPLRPCPKLNHINSLFASALILNWGKLSASCCFALVFVVIRFQVHICLSFYSFHC